MSTPIHYVVGFMFSHDRQRVALIRKQKPVWQHGKLNGIGGKVDSPEDALQAMRREFQEETGYHTGFTQWAHFSEMSGNNDGGEGRFRVDFFTTVGHIDELGSPEIEKVELIQIREVYPLRPDMIENLPWLIGVALDYLHDGRPNYATANYP